jgi:hypothetical protein
MKYVAILVAADLARYVNELLTIKLKSGKIFPTGASLFRLIDRTYKSHYMVM